MSCGKEPDKCAASYMDGIPVKISENFKPPGKVTLPLSVQRLLNSPSIAEEYDFSLERGVLDKLEQWKKHLESQKEERLKKIAEEENWSKMLDETMKELHIKEVAPAHAEVTSPTTCEPVLCQKPQEREIPAVTPVAATTNVPIPTTDSRYPTQPILTPMPLSYSVPVVQTSNNAFNISDFEADTSSPFDNMELKTLNDMEELAHVLQPTTCVSDSRYFSSNSASNYSAPQQQPQPQPIANTSTYAPPVRPNPLPTPFVPTSGPNLIEQLPQYNKTLIGVPPHINGYAPGYSAFSNVEQTPQHHQIQPCRETFQYMSHPFSFSSTTNSSVIPVRTLNGNENVYNYNVERKTLPPNSVPQYPFNMYNFESSKQWLGNQMYDQRMVGRPVTHDSSSLVTSDKGPGTVSITQPPPPPPHPNGPNGPNGPDFVQEIGQLMKKKLDSTAISNSPISNLNKPPIQSSKSEAAEVLSSLSPSAQQLVEQIAEMGFPILRVARAYKTSGDNGKTIVEYLLSMQALIERGHSEQQVEKALAANNNDVAASELFLEAQAQLLDLGFSEDKVTDALVKFNCNRDKALEFLIT